MLFVYLFLLVILLWDAKLSPGGQFRSDSFSRESDFPLRGFFMLLIVFHHLSQQLTNPGSLQLLQGIGLLCVSFFFFQSGYGLTKSHLDHPDYFFGFFRRRYIKLLTPFFLSNLIYLGTNLSFGVSYTKVRLIKCLLGLELVNSHAWFILTVALFYLAFYVIFRFFQRPPVQYALLLCFQLGYALFCMTKGLGLQLFEGPWWFNSSILFFIGALTAGNEARLTGFLEKNYRLLAILSVPVFLLFYTVSVYVTKAFPYQTQDLSPLSPLLLYSWFSLLWQSLAVLSFCAMVMLFTLKVECSNPILRFLGKISVELYLIHGLFIQLFKGQLCFLENDFLFIAAVLSCSVAAAWLLYYPITLLVRKLLQLSYCRTVTVKSTF